ncbi:hypothetical protein AAX26_01023 [Aliarcobacter thereius]|uniref:Uncharacterized protein n=2 Tax=Aliarcobacter thereius TaxID=544718 RepID=A0A1C0B6H1_9BACT|nr:hypothetical protein [Aliarcobacter thereius]OCL86717.1 hypothetical protein AAX26_01023 [Aliarcobacter thereius]OCL90919.1 hypothetical protein AAX25_01087 [Aliarcobacter thereius]OCL96252.1 hypothetical protein AA347_01743 [Aliarcobacter thereius LMG 24486]OCL98886.1 hypothetical protein AAX29_01396 [Aliarcobacter thereius]QBF15783.1 hypothetical protein ATH_0711 [Aliarcobacter thereius LMG 24486]
MKIKIPENIKHLDTKEIKENLFHYSYDNKNLKSLIKKDISKDDLSYITAYSSFKGEIYENIIYELLLKYAQNCEDIESFILKGPYQAKENVYLKSGLLISKTSQIVFKSAYKDISEFDAIFFTKDKLYFVEMSTSKKTSNLNKRLAKKQALLKLIFPFLEINALIVLTKGSSGLKNFPSYATIWLTDDLEDEELINKIIFAKKVKNDLQTLEVPNIKKFTEAFRIKYKKFAYFPTLQWILESSRKNPKFVVDLRFFRNPKMDLYFDIYTKLYIGYLSKDDFKRLYSEFDMDLVDDKVIVTLEKINQNEIDIVYYAKLKNRKLFRIRLEEIVSIKEKEQDGFTNAEVRFFSKVFEEKHILKFDDIKHILKHISMIGFKK